MLDMQTGDLAESDNPLSTVVHELGHWYQYNKQIQQKTNATGDELKTLTEEKDREIIEELQKKDYNTNRVISLYANKSLMKERFGEVFAESLVKVVLGGDDKLRKLLFKGGVLHDD